MLISIGIYWAIYDWLAQLGHTLLHPILANWLILSASCRCSSIFRTCAHWVGQEKSELDIKNIFKPILGGSPTSCSRHWMDPTSDVWITFFLVPIQHIYGEKNSPPGIEPVPYNEHEHKDTHSNNCANRQYIIIKLDNICRAHDLIF